MLTFFSDKAFLLPGSVLPQGHMQIPALQHISGTVNIPAVHMLTRITVKKDPELLQNSAEGQSQAGKKATGSRRGGAVHREKLDLSSVCSECCHSCMWFSTSHIKGSYWAGWEASSEEKGLCIHQNATSQPPCRHVLLSYVEYCIVL